METSSTIAGLIAKHIAGQINEHEREELDQWINYSETNRRFFLRVSDKNYAEMRLEKYRSFNSRRAWEKLNAAPARQKAKIVSIKKWLTAAAVVGIGSVFWVLISRNGNNNEESTAGQPGGHKATLTLADGRMYNLENWHTGVIARPGNYIITKPNDSSIRYEVARHESRQPLPAGHAPVAASHDTIATPRGGQYHVILPDGTDVWLNASSTLRIPISFSRYSRMVELSGEAYFNVNRSTTSDPVKFIVKLANSTIEVMGTQFNVKAYDDEDSVITTVLEGKVQIRTGEVTELVTSNQQARILKNDKIIKGNVDAYEAISWKTRLFQFKDKPLRLILSQACRWYDMEYELKPGITELTTVWIERDKPLSEFLDRLALTTSLRFEVNGRKITVHKPDSQ